MSAQAARISNALGLRRKGGAPIVMVREVEGGLPVAAVDVISGRIAPADSAFKHSLVPKATLARRRAARDPRLSKDESERLVRLASVWSEAQDVWGSDEAARRFMFRPHPLLEGRTPMDVTLSSELGGKVVGDVLGGLAHGTAV